MACWCLLQVAGARELAALPNLQSGPLSFTTPAHLTELHPAHPHQHPHQHPQPPMLQPMDPALHKILHPGAPPHRGQLHPSTQDLPRCSEALYRTDSLGSTASSVSLGPNTPLGSSVVPRTFSQRQSAALRYEPHRQPLQVQAVDQTAEGGRSGRGRGSSQGNYGGEVVQASRQGRQPMHSMSPHSQVHVKALASQDHVKALVGEVVRADNCIDDDTHAFFSRICRKHQWRFYLDVRGEWLQLAHLAVRDILTCAD